MTTEQPTGPDAHRAVHLDSRQIRTLAHPLRARLLGALRLDGPATATTLARELDTNTGATSYHLRRLAEVGLVVEESDRGTGRQRWWRAAHEVSNLQPVEFDADPDDQAAVDWFQSFQTRWLAEQAELWIAAQRDYPHAWRNVAAMSDVQLTLSPRRLRALNDELYAVVERYRRESTPDEADAAQVLVFLGGFPRVTGHRPARRDPGHRR